MIYVISLKSEVARRASIRRKMDSLGLEFQFIDAFDARQSKRLDDFINIGSVYRNTHRNMTSVEIACAFSHRSVYSEILVRNLPGAFVFEDDVIIDDGFLSFYKWFLGQESEFRSIKAIVHLGVSAKQVMDSLVLDHSGGILGDGFKIFDWVHEFSEEAWGAYGYYISHAAAAGVLKEAKIITVADQWSVLVGKERGNIKILLPSCCAHPESFDGSSLEKSRAIAKFQYFKAIYRDPAYVLAWIYRKSILKYLVRPMVRRLFFSRYGAD